MRSTHEDVLPTAIISPEEQSVLPEVCRNRTICLEVDKVGVARPGVSQSADAKSNVFMIRNVFCYFAKECSSRLERESIAELRSMKDITRRTLLLKPA